MLRAHTVILTFVLVLILQPVFAGSDGFSGIRCEEPENIAKALVGKKTANERVVDIEARHQDLGLKDLGASEISDRLFCTSWLICGSEFMLLEDPATVRDVLKFPPHSKAAPQFIGMCEIDGKETKTIVVAVLDAEGQGDNQMLPAKVAWKIDEKRGKFVSMPVAGMRCPRSGMITADGGL